jgi:hypothetical protein
MLGDRGRSGIIAFLGTLSTEGHPMARITEAQVRQYHDEGYFILKQAIPEHHLEMLRAECALHQDD